MATQDLAVQHRTRPTDADGIQSHLNLLQCYVKKSKVASLSDAVRGDS